MSASTYPVRVDASLDASLSRWLWLVKWLLAIPHYIILGFLWVAFAVLSVVAFFAILFTGRYPRAIFDFNVGVLRWTWRVQYYAYGALGTDRYPPFSLEDDPGYPAHLEIEYPQRLSRGLVLVKWWLLAIPQYIIVGLLAGGGTFVAWRLDSHDLNWGSGGLIGILVLVAAIILAVTGSYPQSLFDFVLGLNRWVLRVAAYAGLMTDQYPPFRLDAGGHEPGSRYSGGTLNLRPADGPNAPLPGQTGQESGGPAEPGPGGPGPGRPEGGRGWTAGRVVSLVIGSVLALTAAGLLTGGAGAMWADHARQDGFVTSPTETYTTGGYALATDTVRLPASGWDEFGKSFVRQVRIRVTSSDPAKPVFLGIAPAAAAARYLAGVQYTTLTNLGGSTTSITHAGTAVPTAPASTTIWVASVSGPGTQTLTWRPPAGDWVIVAMNPRPSAGLTVHADAGAELPGLSWLAIGLLAGGLLLLAGGVLLIILPVRRASMSPARTH
ncbi:MAG TPA: DUF4389 domain-containing protein [Streptosporangiaceae bacterium]|nr:DUF4389 domain-containing protein [Streptosporangiaceae bacterium]